MAELRLTARGGVATLTISQPERRNALTSEMWESLPGTVRTAIDDPQTRVLIVEGEGEAFSAGADISEFAERRTSVDDAERYSVSVSAALRELTASRVPTVARIRGACSGGGAAIALACHVRHASDTMRFAIRAARLGIVYELEAVQQLVLVAGQATAYELLSTGRTVEADEALRLRLVNAVHPDAVLDERVDAYAAAIVDNAPLPIEGALVAIAAAREPADAALRRRLQELQRAAIESADYEEGVRAFIEKRTPRFQGR